VPVTWFAIHAHCALAEHFDRGRLSIENNPLLVYKSNVASFGRSAERCLAPAGANDLADQFPVTVQELEGASRLEANTV
jgi:hypothetical protein